MPLKNFLSIYQYIRNLIALFHIYCLFNLRFYFFFAKPLTVFRQVLSCYVIINERSFKSLLSWYKLCKGKGKGYGKGHPMTGNEDP